MKKVFSLIVSAAFILAIKPASAEKIPENAKKLIRYYKERISGFQDNHIVFTDGTRMKWDDGIKNKSYQQLLDVPDLEDMFHDKYNKRKAKIPLPVNYDPGRIRVEPFFLKLYGESADKVRENLREMVWCPKLVGQK
ncbi:MAG: M15 family peptidase, partial [Phormidesmis sp. FL-bin-119]|nr:M15 family peptidase [Pedobacter sp.]